MRALMAPHLETRKAPYPDPPFDRHATTPYDLFVRSSSTASDRVSATFAPKLLRLALALALLASGGLHFHADDPAPAGHWDAASAGELLRSASSHPQAPVHMERVAVERAPRCQVCLLRDRSATVELAIVSFAGADPATAPIAAAPSALVLQRAGDPGRPRGPPRA